MTNAERIRHMTDEELARLLVKVYINSVLDFFEENPILGKIEPPGEEEQKEMNSTYLKLLQEKATND